MLLKGLVSSVCLFLALSATAESAYYTWVDENGVTNYSELKPKGYKARFVTRSYRFGYRVKEEEPVQETPVEEKETARVVDPEKLIAEERARFEAELAEERRFNCDVGQKNLARLEAFARIRIKDDDGNERLMTPEEIEAKKEESRRLIRENCSG